MAKFAICEVKQLLRISGEPLAVANEILKDENFILVKVSQDGTEIVFGYAGTQMRMKEWFEYVEQAKVKADVCEHITLHL